MSLSETREVTGSRSDRSQAADDVSVVGPCLKEVSRQLKDCFSKTIGGLKQADLIPFASRLFSDATFRSCVNFHHAQIPIDRSPDLAIAEGARICAGGRTSDARISLDETIPMEGLSTFRGLVRLNRITTNKEGHLVIGNGNRLPFFLPANINDLTVGGFLAPLFPKGVVEPVPIARLAEFELPRKGTTGPLSEIVRKINLMSLDAEVGQAAFHLYADFQGARRFFARESDSLSWIMGNSSVDWPNFPLPGGSTDVSLRNNPENPEKGSVTGELKNLFLKVPLPSSCFGVPSLQLSGEISATALHEGGTIRVYLEKVAFRAGPLSANVTGNLIFSFDPETRRPILDEAHVVVNDATFEEGENLFSLKGPLAIRYLPQDPKDPDLDDFDFWFEGNAIARFDSFQFTLPLKVWDDPQTGINWQVRIVGRKGTETRQSIGPVTVEEGEAEVSGEGFNDVRLKTKKSLAIGWNGNVVARDLSLSGLLKEGWGSLKADLQKVLEGGRGSVILQGPLSSWLSGRNLKGGYRFSIPRVVDQQAFSVTELRAEGSFAVPSIWKLIERPSIQASGMVRARIDGTINTPVTMTHDGTVGWNPKNKSVVASFDRDRSQIDLGKFDWASEGLELPVAGATAHLGGTVALTPGEKGGFWVSGSDTVGLDRGKVFIKVDGKRVPLLHDVTLLARRLHGINKGETNGEGIDTWAKVNLCLLGLSKPSEGCEAEMGQRGMRRLFFTDSAHWRTIADHLRSGK